MSGGKVLRLDARDNVLVALADLPAGEAVWLDGEVFVPVEEIPAKHKFAARVLPAGEEVIMYGGVVGRARQEIAQGARLRTSNVAHEASGYAVRASRYQWTPPEVARWSGRTFQGYRRADGQTGTRNYWLVLPLVFCENRNVEALREAFEEELGYAQPNRYRSMVRELVQRQAPGRSATMLLPREPAARVFPHVDGIRFLVHEGGCGGTRQDAQALCGLLAGYIQHANVAGATVLSLGCQNAQIEILQAELAARATTTWKPVIFLDQQQSGLESAFLGRAVEETFAGLTQANEARRTAAPIADLTVGLKCGGSDGFSGISANPVLGHVSDVLAALGGRSILSEFPELCGVEQQIMDRCRDEKAAARFAELMQAYAARARAVHSGFEMNPSPGNIQDGLITDAMKSAGAARKSGTSPIEAVLDYPEAVRARGLSLLCTPGNDVECVTAQVGAGANLVLFTTGLGTPTGNPIAPVMKIATNSTLAERMADILDFDTGAVISGEASIAETGDRLLEEMLQVASGERQTQAEAHGQTDFIPWKRGISL